MNPPLQGRRIGARGADGNDLTAPRGAITIKLALRSQPSRNSTKACTLAAGDIKVGALCMGCPPTGCVFETGTWSPRLAGLASTRTSRFLFFFFSHTGDPLHTDELVMPLSRSMKRRRRFWACRKHGTCSFFLRWRPLGRGKLSEQPWKLMHGRESSAVGSYIAQHLLLAYQALQPEDLEPMLAASIGGAGRQRSSVDSCREVVQQQRQARGGDQS